MSEQNFVAPLCSIFRRFLKAKNLKFTTERAQILDAVLTREGLFQAEQLLFEMRRDGQRVSKATIYRTLKHLVEAGIIQQVLIDSAHAHYQLVYGRKSTDYLVNVETDQVIPFHDGHLVAIRERICREHGLEPVGHRFMVYAVPFKNNVKKSAVKPRE